MSIDVLPSCSSASAASALFDQFTAQLASTSSSSGHPSSPPPGRIHRNGPSKKFDPNANADFRFVQNAVAMAVLSRLHRWCCQLFWLTIVCLIGVCSEGQKGGKDDQQFGADNKQSTNRAQTFQDVRKSIVQASQRRGCKTLHELEMQVNKGRMAY